MKNIIINPRDWSEINGGENKIGDEICELLICFNVEEEYSNRYKLNRNYIKPLLHHLGWELYQIEFSTPVGQEPIDVNFCFRSKNAPMAIMPAKEVSYYDVREDEDED